MTPLFDRWVLALLDFVSSTRRIALLYVGNFLFCLIVYMLAEHVSFLEAMWWCTQTWFTVGYGDHIPFSLEGKVFTIYTIVSSHILIVLLTANFVVMLSRYRNKRHAHRYDFCPKHKKALTESIECEACNSPLSFFSLDSAQSVESQAAPSFRTAVRYCDRQSRLV